MKSVGALGTAAILLALAAPASGATWTVQSGGGACPGSGDNVCGSIVQARDAASTSDTIAIEPKSGGWTENVSFNQTNLTVEGSTAGEVRVNGTLTFTGSGAGTTTRVRRLAVFSSSGPAMNVATGLLGTTLNVVLESMLLSGNTSPTGAGLAATTDPTGLGGISITGRHVTIADWDSAEATSFTVQGAGGIDATFDDSVITGTRASGTIVNSCAITNADNAGFVNRAGEDFHLRVDSPAVDGGDSSGGEIAADVEGEDRPAALADWDCGADEFVNHAPTAPVLAAGPNPATVGQQLGFAAQFATDPDAARGDSVAGYSFDFGDGTSILQDQDGAALHAYAAPGQYTATVTARDVPGQASAASNAVTITVSAAGTGGGPGGGGTGGGGTGGGGAGGGGGQTGPDRVAPILSITTPRAGQRLRRGRRAPVLRGRASDTTGVRTVELALRRLEGRRCRWYDSRRRAFLRGACGTPRFFRAVVNDFGWSFTFPRKVIPSAGRYELRARATDFVGNRTLAFTATAKTLTGFRIVR